MRRVFVDTVYYYAILSRNDQYAAAAATFSETYDGGFVTTSAVLTEVGNGLARRKERARVQALWQTLDRDQNVELVYVDATLWLRALEFYSDRSDKQWSLTDCMSFIVMQDRGLTEALTADRHFEQAGFTILLN